MLVERAHAREQTSGSLGIVDALFEALHRAGIGYCHWKSNEHLWPALQGRTDLDLLVDRRDSRRFVEILSALGFKRFLAQGWRAYPGIEDHIGFDPGSGRLVHIHLHHQLTLGASRLKEYRLPWERTILARRIWNDEAGVFVADPAMELLLLIVRRALKVGVVDALASRTMWQRDRRDFSREWEWLVSRADLKEVAVIARAVLGSDLGRVLDPLCRRAAAPTVRELRRLRGTLRRSYRDQRLYGRARVASLRIVRALEALTRRALRRFTGGIRPRKRTPATAGLLVAIVGADGSGKSTAVQELNGWLARKLDVCRIYFGSGDGPRSRLRASVERSRRIVRAILRRPSGGPEHRERLASTRSERSTPGVVRGISALALARERRRNLRRAWRARDRGMIVITDRYPQVEVPGIMDGHRLEAWLQRAAPFAALARWERGVHEWAAQHPPDLVIRLDAPPAMAEARQRGSLSRDVGERTRVVASLAFGGADIEAIDATEPLGRVIARIKDAIWCRL